MKSNPTASEMGKLGRSRNTQAQQDAARANGRKGGRNPLGRSCTRCGKKHLGEWIWLELNTVTGRYHEPGTVPPADSQGLFAFGTACARQALAGLPYRQQTHATKRYCMPCDRWVYRKVCRYCGAETDAALKGEIT